MKVACQRLTVGGKTVAVAPTLGWITDAMHHVVIAETGVPQARGELRYPSIAEGHKEFPPEAGAFEEWEGWIDGINVGDAAGTFKFRISPTSDCGGTNDTDPFTLEPGTYRYQPVTGTGPADFYICLMREVL